MDKIQGYPTKCADYLIPVDVIDEAVQEEKEINLLLNNLNVQGTWDVKALEDMFDGGDVDPFASGFEAMDLEFMLGGEAARALSEHFLAPDKEDADDDPVADVTTDGVGDMDAVQAEAERFQAIKERRREAQAADREFDSPDHVLHFVFPTPKALERWLQDNGMPAHARYVAIEKLEALLDEMYERGLNGGGLDEGADE